MQPWEICHFVEHTMHNPLSSIDEACTFSLMQVSSTAYGVLEGGCDVEDLVRAATDLEETLLHDEGGEGCGEAMSLARELV